MSESDNNDELALSMDFTPLNSENEDVIESGQPNLGQTWDGGPFNFCRTTNDINTTGDGRRAIKFEHIELEEIIAGKETLYCCNGRISFNLLITTVNVFVLTAACVGVALAIVQIHGGSRALVGAMTLRHLLVSAALLLPVGGVLLGCMLLACGSLGLYLCISANAAREQNSIDQGVSPGYSYGLGYNYSLNFGFGQNSSRYRKLDVVYHSLIYLCSLLTLVFTALALSAIILAGRRNDDNSKGVYNAALWQSLTHRHPRFQCAMGERLGCVGFSGDECEGDMDTSIRFSNCAGAFCAGFCRVAPGVPQNETSVHPICRPCRIGRDYLAPFFERCRERELQFASVKGLGCAKPASRNLWFSFVLTISIAVVYVTCIIILNFVTCYRLCYL